MDAIVTAPKYLQILPYWTPVGGKIAPVKNYICSVCGLLSRLSVGRRMDLLNKDLGARRRVGCCLDKEELRRSLSLRCSQLEVDCGSPVGHPSAAKRAVDV